MLTKSKQKIYLKYLGFDSILDLQKWGFEDEDEHDGVYGKKTDILLVNAYRVKKYTKNFELTEFKCPKSCTGYPAKLDIQLLKNLQAVRNKFGATTIKSGLRCKAHNNSMVGSSATSLHMKGRALDIYVSKCKTEKGRKEVMAFVKTLPRHNYTYCNIGGSHPNMATSVHFDVRLSR